MVLSAEMVREEQVFASALAGGARGRRRRPHREGVGHGHRRCETRRRRRRRRHDDENDDDEEEEEEDQNKEEGLVP